MNQVKLSLSGGDGSHAAKELVLLPADTSWHHVKKRNHFLKERNYYTFLMPGTDPSTS